jgi:hypothetical protein
MWPMWVLTVFSLMNSRAAISRFVSPSASSSRTSASRRVSSSSGAAGADEVAGQERDEVPRRAVRPVHVLQHDQQRPSRRRPAELLEHQLVQPALAEAAGHAPPAALEPQPRQQGGERAARVVVEVILLLVERQLA